MNEVIPRKLHYCWFSGKPLPKEFEGYLESWKRFCPDYEIIRWDESNYDISKNAYMAAAYREERWGFVPDYARFDIIYQEGGIYLDTDVELLRSLDPFLQNSCFFGFESETDVNAGLGFGAEKGNPVILKLRELYEKLSFYHTDGSVNLTPSPRYVSCKLEELGMARKNCLQKLPEMTIYPEDYFSPKDYYTGKLSITENTCSIHHFSCTWMSREEKRAEERRKNFCIKYGSRLGNHMDGLYKRLSGLQIKQRGDTDNTQPNYQRLREHFDYSEKRNRERLRKFSVQGKRQNSKKEHFVLLTPALQSCNLGDAIIEAACVRELPWLNREAVKKITTHRYPTGNEERQMKTADLILVAGSNLLGSDIQHCQWKLPGDYNALGQLCLMGCGCSNYEAFSDFTCDFYRKVLTNGWIHSVRDQYTEQKLKEIGIKNVIYTGCPSMWGFTKEFCERIPVGKSRAVVTALTFYQQDPVKDEYQLQSLFSLYDMVYFWPQSKRDLDYLERLLIPEEREKIRILKYDIRELEHVFRTEHPDYAGNRLHAGILALQYGCRSLVVGIDNRATEIGKDTGLPVVKREELEIQLETLICGDRQTEINLPLENIAVWKEQFEGL